MAEKITACRSVLTRRKLIRRTMARTMSSGMHIPMICVRHELRDDQAPGAGRFRSGIGMVEAQRVLTDGIITHESERQIG